ncbi:MAG: DUF481 domain-containing protein, partial [Cyanobacteria bacterium P01_F01_bin.42]
MPWGATWSGDVSLGADLRTGNSETNAVNADLNLEAKWTKHSFLLSADFNREEDDGDTTVDNQRLELTHDYFFIPKWFIESQARFEQDDIDLLDLRTTLSMGLGYQPYDQEDLKLNFIAGLGYLREEFEEDGTDDSATLEWSMNYQQRFYDDAFRLFHENDLSVPADDLDAYIFQSESGMRIPIRSGIIASAEIEFDWDNDPAENTT